MKIRHLKVRVNTDKGLHGTDIKFPDGLVVLWADNTMGKSTCIKSILVALGFEAMITSNQKDLPLPPVMKSELDSNGEKAKVIESDIFLEIENKKGESIVIHRTVKGTRHKNLVSVTYGPALSDPSRSYNSDDYYVSKSGAASSVRGFHRFLADFLNWKLPIVQTFDGNNCPLYLQCIFPYFFVEQTRGWASIDPPIPTQFRIREVNKRSVEFILNLDAYKIATKRTEIAEKERDIEKKWSYLIKEIADKAYLIGGTLKRLPLKPVVQWPPEILPEIVVPEGDDWLPIEKILENNKLKLQELLKEEIPRVNEVAERTEIELSKNQEELNNKETILSRILDVFERERSEVQAVEKRIENIEEDIRKNKDVKTLLAYGSETAPNLVDHICPTCHQSIKDSLTPLDKDQNVMSIDENISFLEDQKRTFKAILQNTRSIVRARETQILELRKKIKDLRNYIRALKETLISDERLPSKAVIRTQIELEGKNNNIESTIEEINLKYDDLEQLSCEWAEIQKLKSELPKKDSTIEDYKKIQRWTDLFTEQLTQYNFQSFDPNSLMVSTDTYRPVQEGFDLRSNISASDFIRVIWSYLTGLLELSREFKTNHTDLLIFDEPKQQSTKELCFYELLERASHTSKYGQQVIFATSEERNNLKKMLEDIEHNYIEFEGRIIKQI